jgi:hypothetical protein
MEAKIIIEIDPYEDSKRQTHHVRITSDSVLHTSGDRLPAGCRPVMLNEKAGGWTMNEWMEGDPVYPSVWAAALASASRLMTMTDRAHSEWLAKDIDD